MTSLPTSARPSPPPAKPRDPEKLFLAATAVHLGKTTAEAASESGVSEATVRSWVSAPWWPDYIADHEQLILERLEALARGVVAQKLREGDAITARWLLERRDRAFAPATKKVEIEGRIDHRHETQALRPLSTAVIERLADLDDDAIDVFFEEARPLELEAEPTTEH